MIRRIEDLRKLRVCQRAGLTDLEIRVVVTHRHARACIHARTHTRTRAFVSSSKQRALARVKPEVHAVRLTRGWPVGRVGGGRSGGGGGAVGGGGVGGRCCTRGPCFRSLPALWLCVEAYTSLGEAGWEGVVAGRLHHPPILSEKEGMRALAGLLMCAGVYHVRPRATMRTAGSRPLCTSPMHQRWPAW